MRSKSTSAGVLFPHATLVTCTEYIRYYHEDRTHLGLAKDTPTGRPVEIRSGTEGTIHSVPRLGGLHHRYAVAA